MRLIKMLGLAAIAAVAAMAFVGVTTASADQDTALCKVHTSLVCPENQRWGPGEKIHLAQVEPMKFLNSVATVLCLEVLALFETEDYLAVAPEPLGVEGTFEYKKCGTNAAHDNCTVTEVQKSLFDILKVALAFGLVDWLSGIKKIKCEKIGGFIDIECEIDSSSGEEEGEGEGEQGNGLHFTLFNWPLKKISGSALCPKEGTLDLLLETLETTPAHVLE